MGRELRRFRVPRRLVIAVLLAAVLLAASTLAGCSTATEPPVRPATSAAATASTELAPQLSTPATTASGPATNQGLPAAGAPGSRTARYVFPVRGCRASYGHGHPYYPATDIFTDRGCRFVAPTDGAVDEVSRVDRWDPSSDRGADRGGLSVSVIGMDGVRYYGSHLQSIAPGIAHGARVRAGQLLGRIDNSGDARTTPTHVHFGLSWPTPPGIWWIRRGLVYAWPYLDAWRAGRNLSPAPAIQAAHDAAGSDIPPCRIRC
jgi:murein DD-endopeptidase MepM/ murein hydrolase activator NlpD